MGCIPLFLQPVEINSSNNNFTVGVDSYTIPSGVYPTVVALTAAINTLITPDSRSAELIFTRTGDVSSFFFKFQFTAPAAVTWNDEDLALLLGWNDDTSLTSATVHVAPNTPEKTWLPNYVESKRASFAIEQGKVIKGTNTGSGNYVGVQAHVDKYRKNFDFIHEPAL
jgi:hypothetical protein